MRAFSEIFDPPKHEISQYRVKQKQLPDALSRWTIFGLSKSDELAIPIFQDPLKAEMELTLAYGNTGFHQCYTAAQRNILSN